MSIREVSRRTGLSRRKVKELWDSGIAKLLDLKFKDPDLFVSDKTGEVAPPFPWELPDD